MSNKLTFNQEKAFFFIRDYINRFKRSPYLREIQAACGIKSHKSVIDRLISLERKGYIKRKVNLHRGIRLNHHKNHSFTGKGPIQ